MKRRDRTHIIYQITTPEGQYIGVTAKTQSTVLRSLQARAAKHWYRAHREAHQWLLCRSLRLIQSRQAVDIRALELIRGKSQAHQRERDLIRQLRPLLNTDRRGCE